MDRLDGHLSKWIEKWNAWIADKLALVFNLMLNEYYWRAVNKAATGDKKRHLQILQLASIIKSLKSLL